MKPNDRRIDVPSTIRYSGSRTILPERMIRDTAPSVPVRDPDDEYDDFYDKWLDDSPENDDRD